MLEQLSSGPESNDLAELFKPDGALSRALPGYIPRPQQWSMAQAVSKSINENNTLVVEAGTGVGKTLSYLLPAILSGGKTIVSTGTKALQDQLYHKDLPIIESVLQQDVDTCLLKGRANYLCLYRLKQYAEIGARFDHSDLDKVQSIQVWSRQTRTGDIAELASVPESSPIWPKVTSTVDNCLGQECPDYGDCHVIQARRRAQEADVVVINHHLFCADLALKDEGVGEILPSANIFIIDEAHQLPQIAPQFFGISIGGRQLIELSKDTVAASLLEAGDHPDLNTRANTLESSVHTLHSLLGPEGLRVSWNGEEKERLGSALEDITKSLDALYDALEQLAEGGKTLQALLRRAQGLRERLNCFLALEDTMIHWYETYSRNFVLNITPLDIANIFAKHKARYPAAWIFTSATLSVGDSFDHFNKQLGLDNPQTLLLGSPYDFCRQACIYRPEGLPSPNASDYTEKMLQVVRPVIEANRGGTFILFTSHRALQIAAKLLQDLNRPLLVQGSAPRGELLGRFRQAGNAVLLGAHSFWEGVDVQGNALTCVVMDRLPFAMPDTPLLKARAEAIRARGGNPFKEQQLPAAVIAFKQGVGRLIRDVHDYGVLVLCDPRIDQKSYGRVFLNSLPPAPIVRDLTSVKDFLHENTLHDKEVDL
ncbi:ATP-dependent DNA helicase [Acidihalobacter prosperus]